MQQLTTAYIGLGSNLGDGRLTLRDAWQALGEVDGVEADGLSNPYTTAPVGMTSQHWFTNAVGRLKVSLGPQELLVAMLEVESSFGRMRHGGVFGYQDRSLDLDLLYFGDLEMDSPDLVLPHPRRAERLFVLVPLAELEPDLIDCQSGSPVSQMAAELTRQLSSSSQKGQEIIRGSWHG